METDDLFDAIAAGDADRLDRCLTASPSSASRRNEQGVSPLMLALYHRRRDLAERIAATGVRLDAFEACAWGDRAAVAAAIDDDPTIVNAEARDGFSLLHLAAFFGHPDLVADLLARGAQVDRAANNPSHVRPLHSAAASRSTEIVGRLLDAGAEADALQNGGFTALMSAALHGETEMAQRLLQAGADPTRAAEDGRTAIEMARGAGHEALADRLAAAAAADQP